MVYQELALHTLASPPAGPVVIMKICHDKASLVEVDSSQLAAALEPDAWALLSTRA